MKELRKTNRGLFLAALWIVVFFSVEFLQEFGAWVHMMLECVVRLFGAETYVIEVPNYPAYITGMYTLIHMQVVVAIWTFIVWGTIMFFKRSGKRLHVCFLGFITIFVIATVLLESVHYVAYFVEFVLDVIASRIKSMELSSALKDSISMSRWKSVDWVARCCEGYLLTRVVFGIANILEKRKKDREQETE